MAASNTAADERRHLVVVGASAGGVEAISKLLRALPDGLDATVLVVLHIPATGGTGLPRIFERATSMRVRSATDGERLAPETVLVAPGDHHLSLEDGVARVRRGPRENGHRPAVDVLFRSAAGWHGASVIAIVLSGTLDDGAAGAAAVRRRGGLVLVEDPDSAAYGDMPAAVLRAVAADHVGTPADLGRLLPELVGTRTPAGPPPPGRMVDEVKIANGEMPPSAAERGTPSPWPCPDCSGVLWEVEDDDVLRFRCRVGHAWSSASLLEKQSDEVEAALWAALRALEDRAALVRRMAERADEGGRDRSAERWHEDADELTQRAAVLRRLLEAHDIAAGADA